MILRDKLAKQSGPKEFPRFLRIAEIVTQALARPIDEEVGVALIDVLANRRIALVDGTEWNNPLDPINEIWTADAAVVVSALTQDPDEDWHWWKRRHGTFAKDSSDYERLIDDVVSALSASPAVKWVEP